MKTILNIQKPLIGLSPMDGVTDSAFRYIVKKYGNADLVFTEFTHVMAMCIAGDNVMQTFHYDETQRPIIGQIYGKEPEYFYHAAKIICALGFDGVDINMGCPAKTVASSGAGAALIKTPDLAREIIAAVKQGVADWVADGKLTGLSERSIKGVEHLLEIKNQEIITDEQLSIASQAQKLKETAKNGLNNLLVSLNNSGERLTIPVSVKTRVGYDIPITESWITNLTKADPAWISVHGRTLKQLYTGFASREELKIAVKSTDLPVLVNGDIKDKKDFQDVLELTNAYGVLVGRGTYGNPWIFKEMRNEYLEEITKEDRLKVMIEHTKKFIEIYAEPKLFVQLRKHFGWYAKGFDNASELRGELMRSNSLEEVINISAEYL